MPANLPPQYYEAEKRYREAKDPSEKLVILEEMLRIMPKHKGTDKLQADLKRKISKLKNQPRKKGATVTREYLGHVRKEGAGQVAIIGAPNVGKSSLVNLLTGATPEVADYPFTTRVPIPGMMRFENIWIQLVDTPPISRQYMENWLPEIVRHADLVLLMVDLSSDDVLDQFDSVIAILGEKNIELDGRADPRLNPLNVKRTLVVANKLDSEGSKENLSVVEEFFGERFPILPVSVTRLVNVGKLEADIFDGLRILRVYTKSPGKPPDMEDPVILPIGGTVEDMALEIHKDFARNLAFAKVWGKHTHDGQRIHRDFVLTDGDIVEFHI